MASLNVMHTCVHLLSTSCHGECSHTSDLRAYVCQGAHLLIYKFVKVHTSLFIKFAQVHVLYLASSISYLASLVSLKDIHTYIHIPTRF